MLAQARAWLRSMGNRSRIEREMAEELRFHIQSYENDLIRSGCSREEARRRSRLEFGAVESLKEDCRASLGLRLWDEVRSDVRSGLRVLRQSPVFTVVAVISLGLGIGANTAIFTLADSLLLKNMSVPHPDQLRIFTWVHGPNVHMGHMSGSMVRNKLGEMVGTSFPYPLYRQMQRDNSVMEDLAAFRDIDHLTATIDGQPEAVDGLLVSGNYYQVLQANVEAGREIAPSDDSPDASAVVVLSDAFWTRRFGRSADVLGKTIRLNRVPVTVIGINAPEFTGSSAIYRPQVFFPIGLQQQVIPDPEGSLLAKPYFWSVVVIGRLRTGVTNDAARAALAASFRSAFHTTLPGRKESDIPRFVLSPGERGMDMEMDRFKKSIYLLLTVAGLVLLIACANLANLLLARAAVRQREISVRLAMGAGRMRIMRQILTESLILAFLGGAAGLLLGYLGRNIIPHLLTVSWHETFVDAQFDWHVFVFGFLITALTGLLFGVGPAWRCTRNEAHTAFKETRRMTITRPKALFGKALVVFQVAVSLLLLACAGLFLRTLTNLRSASNGINAENIILFAIDPPESHYSTPNKIVLFQQIMEGLSFIPGVQKVSASTYPLLANSTDTDCFHPTGQPASGKSQDIWDNNIGANFFETFGLPIITGRPIDLRDNEHAPKTVVINRQLARRFFPNTNPIGQSISPCDARGDLARMEVVGVSADAKFGGIRGEPPATLYIPFAQADDLRSMTFEVKTSASLGSMLPKFREVVRRFDNDLPLLDVRTQTQQVDAILRNERMFAMLTSAFGLLALTLSSIGIYGVMAYTVSGRTNEIGIRMALGARSAEVLRMVLGETSLLAGVGVALGICGAIVATKLVASMLYGLRATDSLTFATAALLLLAVGLLASIAPAWRAATIDPVNALRHE